MIGRHLITSSAWARADLPLASQAGFTLLELLLALGIFALVSAMAYGGLRSVLEAHESLSVQTARLAALQKSFLQLARDLEQAVPRGIRDAYGDAQRAFLGEQDLALGTLEFTRVGRPNPARLTRSELQRVAYGVRDGNLHRWFWAVLDRGDDRSPYEQTLLENVQELRIRYLDSQRTWQETWPPQQDFAQDSSSLPVAVEIVMEVTGVGSVTRLFRLVR